MENEYYEKLYNEELEIAASQLSEQMRMPYDEAYRLAKDNAPEIPNEIDVFEMDPPEMDEIYEDPNGLGYLWVLNNLGAPFVLFEKVTMQRKQLLTILCGFNLDNFDTFHGSCDTFKNLTDMSYYKWQQADDEPMTELSGLYLRYVLNNQQLIRVKWLEFQNGDDSVNTHFFHIETDLCKRKVLFEKVLKER